MRSSLRKTGRPVHAMVEQLEGRRLLSAWAGTWKVKGIEFDASPALPNGDAGSRAAHFRVTITDVGPGQYQLSVPAYGYTTMLTGDATQIELTETSASDENHLLLRMVDPGVILVARGGVTYETADRQSIVSAGFFGGIATRKAAPTVTFAWDGQYTAHGTMFSFGWGGEAYGSQLATDDQPISVSIVQAGPGQYMAGAATDPELAAYNEIGGRLIHEYAGSDPQGGDRYLHRYEQVWRGPYGRIYHLGGVAEFGSPDAGGGGSGQLLSGWLDATYSDPHVNVAPELDKSGSPTFDAINEDDVANAGTSVGDLLSRGGSTYVYDANGNSRGIAVVGTDTKRGTWQYSLDGSTWQDVGKVTGSSALLLDGTAKLRFVPKTNYFGTLTKAITFRAWDESDVTIHPNGGRASVNASGKTTAFSKATDVASLVVNPVNDAPTLVGFDVPLTHTLGGPAVSVGAGVKLIDVDNKMLSAATITFSGSLVAGEDLIAYRAVTGITGNFDAATNTLTLSGVATLSRYLAALKAVSFKVAAATSSAPTRTITFTLADELGETSLSVDRLLQITA